MQLYVGCKKGATSINRPVRELRRFEKVSLQPGESKTVIFTLDQRCFSYWDEGAHAFRVPGGDYTIEICQDAATVLLQQEITVEDEYIASGQKYDLMTPIVDVQKHPLGKAFMEEVQPMIDAVIARMDMGKSVSADAVCRGNAKRIRTFVGTITDDKTNVANASRGTLGKLI